MFCRRCHYDLRGQIASRCPECGLPFDPEDPQTFYPVVPSLVVRLLQWPRWWRKAAAVLLTIVLVAWFALPICPSLCHERADIYMVLGHMNLRQMCFAWKLQVHDDPDAAEPDRELVKQDVGPSFSPWSEGDKIKHIRLAHDFEEGTPRIGAPLLVYAILMICVCRRRARRVAVVASLLLLVVWIASSFAEQMADSMYPGSYAYIDDYVYISGLDWSTLQPKRHDLVIAYSKFNSHRDLRVVAFMDGRTTRMREDKLRTLLEDQGRTLLESVPDE